MTTIISSNLQFKRDYDSKAKVCIIISHFLRKICSVSKGLKKKKPCKFNTGSSHHWVREWFPVSKNHEKLLLQYIRNVLLTCNEVSNFQFCKQASIENVITGMVVSVSSTTSPPLLYRDLTHIYLKVINKFK